MNRKIHHDYQTVSSERHGSLTWHPPRNFSFAADWIQIPLMEKELRTVCCYMPIAIHRTRAEWRVVAISGTIEHGNTCIDRNNKWRLPYTPASVRSYPFRLDESPRPRLCIDESSGLLDRSYDGHPFFDTTGALSTRLSTIRRFLKQCEAGRHSLARHARQLAQLEILEPWTHASEMTGIPELYRANPGRLKDLSQEAFSRLQSPGLLQLLFAQNLSEKWLDQMCRSPAEMPERNAMDGSPTQHPKSSENAARELIGLMHDEMAATGSVSEKPLNRYD